MPFFLFDLSKLLVYILAINLLSVISVVNIFSYHGFSFCSSVSSDEQKCHQISQFFPSVVSCFLFKKFLPMLREWKYLHELIKIIVLVWTFILKFIGVYFCEMCQAWIQSDYFSVCIPNYLSIFFEKTVIFLLLYSDNFVINWLYTCGIVSECSVLFSWSVWFSMPVIYQD